MKKGSLAALGIVLFATICLGTAVGTEPLLDGILRRYPGAVRMAGEHVDAYYLDHGWLTRQADYQSPDDLITVTRWYAGYLPRADTHESASCVTLRQSQTFIHILHTASVLLCQQRPGTRIILEENVYLAP